MGRKSRSEYGGEWHHITNRGARRQLTFFDDHDRTMFLSILERAESRTEIDVVAYCLMDNHIHIVVRAMPDELAKFMQYLASVYTRQFNHRHGFDGALFKGRFYSKEVLTEAQLMVTVRYVHRNPLDIDFDMDLTQYRWSSHRWYATGERGPKWLKRRLVLGLAGGPVAFDQFVLAEPDFAGRRMTRS